MPRATPAPLPARRPRLPQRPALLPPAAAAQQTFCHQMRQSPPGFDGSRRVCNCLMLSSHHRMIRVCLRSRQHIEHMFNAKGDLLLSARSTWTGTCMVQCCACSTRNCCSSAGDCGNATAARCDAASAASGRPHRSASAGQLSSASSDAHPARISEMLLSTACLEVQSLASGGAYQGFASPDLTKLLLVVSCFCI